MNVFNLFDEQQWDSENDQPGYRHRTVAIGKRLGGRLLGGSLYELPPGQKTWPYHYELGCEEWLIAVSGHPRSADRTASESLRRVTSWSSPKGRRVAIRSSTGRRSRPES